MLSIATKVCKKCGVDKPLTEYHAHTRLQYQPRCKQCRAEYQRAYYASNVDKFIAYKARVRGETIAERSARIQKRRDEAPLKRRLVKRKVYIRNTFGITLKDYDSMLAAQDGKCAICGTTKPGRNSPYFHIDHCHTTNVVRGLLCNGCNLGLGHFKDSPDRLSSAITYLMRYPVK